MIAKIKVKKLHEDARIPEFQHEGDAGFDIFSTMRAVIIPGETRIISTGLAFEIPEGFEMQIRSRSGLSAKNGVQVHNSPGTIDSGYRGEVKVILHNSNEVSYEVLPGMRIAQGVINELPKVFIQEVDELSDTERGEGGFGSTGIN